MIALILLIARLSIPIPGTGAVSDPREIFTTISAAFSGPVGALIIAFLAGIAEPSGVPLASILAHSLGCIWISLVYRFFIYRSKILRMFFLWALSVLIYYFVFLINGYLMGLIYFYAQPLNYPDMYMRIAAGVYPEAIITIVITSLMLIVLPARYRQPWWI